MRYCVSFITDIFFAFFGFVTGREFGAYPAWYALLGGVFLIGGLLLLSVLAGLVARRLRMPLPPEEREGATEDGADGCDAAGDEPAEEDGPDREKQDGEAPGNRAQRCDTPPSGDTPGRDEESRRA